MLTHVGEDVVPNPNANNPNSNPFFQTHPHVVTGIVLLNFVVPSPPHFSAQFLIEQILL